MHVDIVLLVGFGLVLASVVSLGYVIEPSEKASRMQEWKRGYKVGYWLGRVDGDSPHPGSFVDGWEAGIAQRKRDDTRMWEEMK